MSYLLWRVVVRFNARYNVDRTQGAVFDHINSNNQSQVNQQQAVSTCLVNILGEDITRKLKAFKIPPTILSQHITTFPRPSNSIFAYWKESNTSLGKWIIYTVSVTMGSGREKGCHKGLCCTVGSFHKGFFVFAFFASQELLKSWKFVAHGKQMHFNVAIP